MFFGDYHTHTTFSHGTGSIEDNVKHAVSLGLKEIAITDHGFGHIAYGVRRREYPVMRAEVERLKLLYPEINIMLGLECNFISLMGDVDLNEGEDKLLDIEVCGFHKFAKPMNFSSAFSFVLPNVTYSIVHKCGAKQIAKNTDAYIKLIENNKIDILSHMNYAIKSDAVEVARACKHFGTYVELNGKRVNFTDAEIEKMMEENVPFIVDSDAHKPQAVGGFSVPLAIADRLHIPYESFANWDKLPSFRSKKS